MTSDSSDDMQTKRLLALGSVITASGVLEDLLREAFCALVGSKFAAVVAGGQGADWLIGYCKALVEAHFELPEASRESVKAALQLCRSANDLRNQLVHGVQTVSTGSDGAFTCTGAVGISTGLRFGSGHPRRLMMWQMRSGTPTRSFSMRCL